MLRSLLLFFILVAAAVGGDGALAWKTLPPLPDPLGVAAPFAGVSGGALVVAGGANFPEGMPWKGGKKMWHQRVWVLEKPEGPWREAGKLPRPLAYGISATWRDRLICVGGSDSERHYADAFQLVWQDGVLTTEPLPPFPISLSGACGALIGDVLYVACGAENPGERTATNRAFALHLAAAVPEWVELPPLPGKARILAMGAAHEAGFYVLGGAALEPDTDGKIARVFLRDAWRYEEDRGWQRVADLPKPVAAAPSPLPYADGRLLILAGDDGSRIGFQPIEEHPGFPDSILAYDPALDRWTETGKVPAPRATAPVVEWQGRFVIPSGEVRPGVRSPEVWTFSPR